MDIRPVSALANAIFSGKCYIDYDIHNGEEYLKAIEGGDSVVYRYLSLKVLPQKAEISGVGKAVIDIYMNHVHVGGGKSKEDGKTVFLLDCCEAGGDQAEVELVFGQTESFKLKNMVFL